MIRTNSPEMSGRRDVFSRRRCEAFLVIGARETNHDPMQAEHAAEAAGFRAGAGIREVAF